MITDQQLTGVPSAAATRERTQYTKPIQTGNSGRVAPQSQAQGQSQLGAASNPVSELYNPIQAKSTVPSTAMDQTAAKGGINSSVPYATRSAVGLGGAGLGQSSIAQSNVDRAAAIIAEMDDDEAMELLNGIANGTIKNKGPKSSAMATGTTNLL